MYEIIIAFECAGVLFRAEGWPVQLIKDFFLFWATIINQFVVYSLFVGLHSEGIILSAGSGRYRVWSE